MSKEMTTLKFYFRNGETWTISRRHIGDLWIKRITTNLGRISGSGLAEIHPCAGFEIGIFHERGTTATHDISLGGLEIGVFNCASKYKDIERVETLCRNGTFDLIYFPHLDKGTEELDNQYQSTKISEKAGNLYIMTNPDQRVEDVYGEFFKWIDLTREWGCERDTQLWVVMRAPARGLQRVTTGAIGSDF